METMKVCLCVSGWVSVLSVIHPVLVLWACFFPCWQLRVCWQILEINKMSLRFQGDALEGSSACFIVLITVYELFKVEMCLWLFLTSAWFWRLWKQALALGYLTGAEPYHWTHVHLDVSALLSWWWFSDGLMLCCLLIHWMFYWIQVWY